MRTGKGNSSLEGTEPANQACRQMELGAGGGGAGRMHMSGVSEPENKGESSLWFIPPTDQAVSFPEHLLS